MSLLTAVTFSNLIGDIADRTPGASKYEICNAIGQDSRVGIKYLRPGRSASYLCTPASHVRHFAGYGFGGPCFPRDNRALGGYGEPCPFWCCCCCHVCLPAGEMVGVDALLFKATDTYNKYHTQIQLKAMLEEGELELWWMPAGLVTY